MLAMYSSGSIISKGGFHLCH